MDPAGTITVPNQDGTTTVINPNGTVDLPNGAGTITPEGGDATVEEDGSVKIPTQDGAITVDPEGNMTVPNGGAHDTQIDAGADVTVEENGSNSRTKMAQSLIQKEQWTYQMGLEQSHQHGPVTVDKDGNVTIPTAKWRDHSGSSWNITVPNKDKTTTVINPNGTVELPNGDGTITPEVEMRQLRKMEV